MAPPPHGLSTHDAGAKTVDARLQFEEAFGKGLGRHVVRVPTKHRASPRGVRRIRGGPPAPSQAGKPVVAEAGSRQGLLERCAREVRPSSRAGIPADIDHQLDVVLGQKLNELREPAGRMTDSPNSRQHAGSWPRDCVRSLTGRIPKAKGKRRKMKEKAQCLPV